MLFLFFFSILGEWGGGVLESMENSILFFLNPSLNVLYCLLFTVYDNIFSTNPTVKKECQVNLTCIQLCWDVLSSCAVKFCLWNMNMSAIQIGILFCPKLYKRENTLTTPRLPECLLSRRHVSDVWQCLDEVQVHGLSKIQMENFFLVNYFNA